MNFLKNIVEMMFEHPEAWALAFWAPCFVLLLAAAKWPGGGLKFARLSWLGGAIGLLTLGLFGWLNYRYLASAIELNAMPAQVFEVSWYFEQGHPLYHDAHSPEFYSMLYGPYLYIFTGTLEKWLGPGIFAAKLAGQLSTLSTLGLLGVLLWRRGSKLSTALLFTAIFACLIVTDPLEVYFDRADNFIVLFLVIGAWAAYSPTKLAPLILGAAIGISVDLKVHAFLYFIPLAWVAWRTGHRWKGVGLALGTAAVVALLPFLAFSNISLRNYFWILHTASHHGLNPPEYMNVVFRVCCYSVPLGLAFLLSYLQDARATVGIFHRYAGFIGSLVFATLVLIVPASKIGSGPYHLLPMAIIVILLMAELVRAGLQWPGQLNAVTAGLYAVLASWLISCLGVGMLRSHQYGTYFKLHTAWADDVQADIDGILKKYGTDHIVLMGNSDNGHYDWTYFRTSLIFQGQPVGLEPAALADLQYAGVVMPTLAETSAALVARQPGKKILWLVPPDAVPFSLNSYYAKWDNNEFKDPMPVYSQQFRTDFAQAFHRVDSSRYFDLYSN